MIEKITARTGTALTVLLLAGGPMIAAGCSSNEATSPAATTIADSKTVDADDVMFAQMMIPHHEQAIELSDMALDPTTNASPEVLALAERIKAAQDPEISRMSALLEAWGEPVSPMDGMDHGSMMSGMLSAAELAAIDALTGSAFDDAWLAAMVAHHQGAISMAQEVLDNGSDIEIRSLAEAIIAGQQAEIDEMNALLAA